MVLLFASMEFDLPSMHPLNPALRILLWVGVAVVIPYTPIIELIFLTGVSVVWLSVAANGISPVVKMLKRSRWLLLALFVLYGFASPGQALVPQFSSISPTIEGLSQGCLQAWRLATVLVTLSLLQHYCSRDQILAGLYTLMRPFRAIWLNAERLAARISLTLAYAQSQTEASNRGWAGFNTLLNQVDLVNKPHQVDRDSNDAIVLSIAPWTWVDYFTIGSVLLLLIFCIT